MYDFTFLDIKTRNPLCPASFLPFTLSLRYHRIYVFFLEISSNSLCDISKHIRSKYTQTSNVLNLRLLQVIRRMERERDSYATSPTCAAASLACCSSFFLCLSSCDKKSSSEWCLCSRSFYYNNVLREDWKAKDFSLAVTIALWWLQC